MTPWTPALLALLSFGLAAAANEPPPAPEAGRNSRQEELSITSWGPAVPVCRAGRSTPFSATIRNAGEQDTTVAVRLLVPEGVRILKGGAECSVAVPAASAVETGWQLEAITPGRHSLRLALSSGSGPDRQLSASAAILFLPPAPQRKLDAIPAPAPVQARLLIGAHHCPLWEADKPQMWANVLKHPERTPALGFYAQENPEVSDWETKWAVEHGISFFVYCWYRASQGGPVEMRFGSALHEAFFKSRFRDKMKFTIMWENQTKGSAGVADLRDLRKNLFPFWMENYFKHPSYLKVDDCPVLFIYRPEFLVNDLGSVPAVAEAFDWMRAECRRQGFAGLTILGEYRGLDARHLQHMKSLGLDYSFAYCWHVPGSPAPDVAIAAQLGFLRKTQELGILPQVATVSQAWSGWRDEGSIWKIPPAGFERLLREAGGFIESLPKDRLSGRMLLLDNWNEWGEGHYIAPYREHGFGYLDAVRKTFTDAPGEHSDLLPEDIGLGPYDTAYRETARREADLRRLESARVTEPGADEPGLVGWWTFDEPADHPVARDVSGHRLGGRMVGAARGAGVNGQALICEGGCVEVPDHPLLSPGDALSLECWVMSRQGGQKNHWIVNRIFSGGTATGYRLGIVNGKPCFAIPVTDWSHHLLARDDLPTGRWVHLAGTFDGRTMRIYVDGQEQGTLERPGPVAANTFRLCIGNYDRGHSAHFTGSVDEVKLYHRALDAAEILRHARPVR